MVKAIKHKIGNKSLSKWDNAHLNQYGYVKIVSWNSWQ
jgi:hypothetical protein